MYFWPNSAKNKVTVQGSETLCDLKYPKLRCLDLCTLSLTKHSTASPIKA
jgi:hypothetical protein